MEGMSPELERRNRTSDRIFDAAYLEEAAGLPNEELQQRRKECALLEEQVSYFRRVIQGKIDILHHLKNGEPGDSASLVAALPSILADKPVASRGLRHLNVAVPELQGRRELDKLLDSVVDPASLSGEDLDEAISRLSEAEDKVSGQRQRLLELIDAIDEQLVARYQQGNPS